MNKTIKNLALLALSAAAATGAYADDAAFSSTAGIGNVNGEHIYTHICQGCHMPAGEGATGAGFYPKLAGDKKLVSWEFAAITVLNGRKGMPAFGLPPDQVLETRSTYLSDAQVAEVVNYLRSHFDNRFKPTVTAKQVTALPHPSSVPAMF